jgi:RNA polymerase sigma-70 factor (ECF subfamily)
MQLQITKEKELKIAYYYPALYKFALFKLKSTEQAFDVTQEVFCRYIEFADNFESEQHEKNWLFFTASNICNSYWRSGWYKHVFLDDSKIETVHQGSQLSDFIEKEDASLIRIAVMKLSYKDRELIHLFYYENMSIKEISYVTGRKESTIQTQLSRAREKLKKKLEEIGYERF